MIDTSIHTTTIGRLRIHAIQSGGQKLDGGAMFGVVPKPLWEKHIPADARNRIQLGMRCVVVEHESGVVLIDSGAGNKESAKFHEIYGVENAGADGRTLLEDGLRQLGIGVEDVAYLINTHLHFDHAGGNTYRSPEGAILPTFPRARYIVQRRELEFARLRNERIAASYFPHNYDPLEAASLLDPVDGECVVLSGITVLPTPGHVPAHQSVLIESGGEGALYLGDVVPTRAHLPLPWIMGYDVEPLVTLESKRGILAKALERRWLLLFEHDADVPWGRAAHDGKTYSLEV